MKLFKSSRIRWAICITGLLSLCVSHLYSQNPISKVEYFFDTDPGFGNGVNVAVTPAPDISALNIAPTISSLSYGIHEFCIRSRDAAGNWSLTNSASFVKYAAQGLGDGGATSITRLEYFFDADPGFGNGTNIPIVNSPDLNNLALPLNVAPLSSGFHTLSIRSRDSLGRWSLTNSSSFVKYAALGLSDNPIRKINYAEYFIDADPGFGSGISIPVTAANDISGIVVPVNINSLPFGFHTMSVRTRDSVGRWSLTNAATFVKYAAQNFTDGDRAKINKLEYFIDTDPGFGLGTDVPISPGLDIGNILITPDISSLSSGFHVISFRSRDSLGRWSLTNSAGFVKYSPLNLADGTKAPSVRVEYFVDADPGFGNGINVPMAATLDTSGLIVPVDISALRAGFHTISCRSLDSSGRWSLTNHSAFIKYAPQVLSDGPVVNINKMEYFFDADPGFGNGFNVSITPSTDISNLLIPVSLNSVAPGFHVFHIRSQDSLGRWSLTNHSSFTGGSLQAPTASITIVGTQPLCIGTGYLKVNRDASPLATYQWKLNNTNIPGATDSIYFPSQSGSYTVVVTNPVGTATATAVNVTVHPAVTVPITAFGPTTFCEGGSVLLEAAPGFSSYLWSNQTIGRTITASASDSLIVEVTDANGCKVRNGIRITVKPKKQFSFSRDICSGESFFFNGQNISTAGSYVDTLTASNGCDSIVTLNLAVNPQAFSTLNAVICSGSSYFFNGRQLTSAGSYYDTLQTANGCDSIIHLQLSLSNVLTASLYDTICSGQNYLFNGVYLTTAGQYRDTLSTAGGCDSIITLLLAVQQKTNVSIGGNPDLLCIGSDPVVLTGGLPAGGVYSGPGVTGNTFDPMAAGLGSHLISYSYTSAGGCTDTATEVISVELCTGISVDESDVIVSIFPNPASDQLLIKTSTGKLPESIHIYNVAGAVVDRIFEPSKNKINIHHYPPGVYVAELKIGSNSFKLRWVKL